MNDRKQQLLKLIIENYISTGLPVGSRFLIETSELEVSAATVRNEMRDLEEEGMLTHPHTSSGRIPTEAGYRYYVENLMKTIIPENKIKQEVDLIIKQSDYKEKAKSLGKLAASKINSAVIIAFERKSVYYTGISNLFSQPEFRDYAHTVQFSAIFDQCEDRMDDLYEKIDSENAKILIGNQNPLGGACGLIGARLNKNDLFAVLGPMRMDYRGGLGILDYIQSVV